MDSRQTSFKEVQRMTLDEVFEEFLSVEMPIYSLHIRHWLLPENPTFILDLLRVLGRKPDINYLTPEQVYCLSDHGMLTPIEVVDSLYDDEFGYGIEILPELSKVDRILCKEIMKDRPDLDFRGLSAHNWQQMRQNRLGIDVFSDFFSHDDLERLKEQMRNSDFQIDDRLYFKAAFYGSVSCFRHLYINKNPLEDYSFLLILAFSGGSEEIISLLVEDEQCKLDRGCFRAILWKGNPRHLEWALSHFPYIVAPDYLSVHLIWTLGTWQVLFSFLQEKKMHSGILKLQEYLEDYKSVFRRTFKAAGVIRSSPQQ